MAPVTVTLKISPDSKKALVTLDPLILELDEGDIIYWNRGNGLDFTFIALVFKKENPFANTIVSPKQIVTDDEYDVPDEFPYTIYVKANGTYYSSDDGIMAPGPTIRNK
jgi:hypothetical protein